MSGQRHPYDGEAIRRAVLAMAEPGQLLPVHTEIAEVTGSSRANVGRHIDILRDQWRLVTRPGPGKRLMVVEVRR